MEALNRRGIDVDDPIKWIATAYEMILNVLRAIERFHDCSPIVWPHMVNDGNF